MGWPHTLRPKGCSAISSGVQATYQAFFGYMFVSPVVGQNLPSALYARLCKSPRRLYTQETGTTDIAAWHTAQALVLRSAAAPAARVSNGPPPPPLRPKLLLKQKLNALCSKSTEPKAACTDGHAFHNALHDRTDPDPPRRDRLEPRTALSGAGGCGPQFPGP